jgi:signal transduction histidine kinase
MEARTMDPSAERDARDAFLDAVSRSAGSIAHGINNLLTSVGGFVEMSLQRVEAGRDAKELLVAAAEATNAAGKVVAALMGFARRQRLSPVVVDLASFAARRLPAWRTLAGAEADVELVAEPDLPPVRFDEDALDRAVLALVDNARDALAGTGRIEVRLARDPEGDGALLSVADAGPGIPDEVRRHLFEPFVTTKRAQGNRGLGLAWVYGTLRQSGGAVRWSSAPGSGTTVTLRLPPASEPGGASK